MSVKIVNFSSNIIASIFSLILGVILFTRPDLVTIFISYILGSILIIYGISKIIYFSYQKGKDDKTSYRPCISGIILIIIGLICIFLSGVIEQILRFIIGAFILLSGINRIIKAMQMDDKKGSQFIAILIVSLILIAIGLYVIFVSNLIFSSMGIILIIYSVIEIINYIILASNKNNYIYEGSTNVNSNLKTIETTEVNKDNKKKDSKNKKEKKNKK